MTPVFIVMYVITFENGRWPVVFLLQLIVTITVVLAAWGYFGVAIWVSPDEISERGFFGRKFTFARAEIGSIVMAEQYGSSGADPVPQLFVADHDGKQLVRMRGQFWSRESMETVRSSLDFPATVLDEAVTSRELARTYPGLLYWFERHPVRAALFFTAVVVVVAGLVMGFLYLADLR